MAETRQTKTTPSGDFVSGHPFTEGELTTNGAWFAENSSGSTMNLLILTLLGFLETP
jgi:hypothetical protein